VRSCDVTVVVTEEERREILASVPEADVVVLPTIQSPAPEAAPLDGRSGIVFVGSFHHSPNADAAIFLVRRVMPHVWRRQADARVTIVGQDPPAGVEELAGPQVAVTGWVEELVPLLAAARVAVVPVRYGAGLKLKTIEAMAYGLPVVSTELGAEGLHAADGVHLLLADEPEEIADRICALLADDALWRRLSDGGRDLVRERFAPAVMMPRVRALLTQPSR
jgi:glycosyltransferase involved in cell wall biosynthesis